MDQKEGIKMEYFDKAEVVTKHQSASLWEGEIRLRIGEKSEDILAPVHIFHKDDSKTGCKLFDWTPGKDTKTHHPQELQLNNFDFQVFPLLMQSNIQ